ncbi:MAG: DegT/DnrJ/EryC1/StrS family aminotransferase [Phenylobacterium sp.]|nr:MAG: DegT/DnrJ/EryC1/StrS family aminotransferase [Phenylobacterium sp.]
MSRPAPAPRAEAAPMNFFNTNISEEAVAGVERVLRSGMLSEGRLVAQFEQKLRDELGIRGPVALNSGTSALHLALVVAGVGDGDEVIIPAQTFIATGMAVLMQGAKPVFADIQPITGNIDPDSIRAKLTERTRAIIPVHWAGYPCDMDEIAAVAAEADAAVIEDAAHALGASYRGRPVGALSRFTAFSFQAIKHLTTGDGGALACLEAQDEHAARTQRWFAIDRANSHESLLGEREYDAVSIGFKYHMNDVAAAIGVGNLPAVPRILARHQAIADRYAKELAQTPGLELTDRRSDRVSANWFFPVLVERREDFIHQLRARECVASVVHRRIDTNSVFGGKAAGLPGQDAFDERQCALPIHMGLTDDDVGRTIAAINEGW